MNWTSAFSYAVYLTGKVDVIIHDLYSVSYMTHCQQQRQPTIDLAACMSIFYLPPMEYCGESGRAATDFVTHLIFRRSSLCSNFGIIIVLFTSHESLRPTDASSSDDSL